MSFAELFASRRQDPSSISEWQLQQRVIKTYLNRWAQGTNHRIKPSNQEWPPLSDAELDEALELCDCVDLTELY